MPTLPDASIDLVLADLPFGTTKCKWDIVLPFDQLWLQWKRLLKPDGVVILFGTQPFTSVAVQSNLDWFKYEIIWEKEKGIDIFQGKRKPLTAHENVEIFYNKSGKYNVQLDTGFIPYTHNYNKTMKSTGHKYSVAGSAKPVGYFENVIDRDWRYPKTVRRYKKQQQNLLHPTQKPTTLLSWLIKSYTKAKDIVLDPTMGSASTCIACLQTNRNYIGIEKDTDYFNIATKRIEEEKSKDMFCEQK
jgi:site-specific DNA-methyltransferase (adenine-specific)